METEPEAWHMTIDLDELQRAMDTVIAHLRERCGGHVDIPEDYFWSVPFPAIYDVPQNPELTIGQLTESWDNLRDERRGNDERTIAWASVWLGDILKAIGHNVLG